MDVALAVVSDLIKKYPPRTIFDVVRHIKTTLESVHDTTVSPKALLNQVIPLLPESLQDIFVKSEDLFDHIWEDLDSRETGCFCIKTRATR